MTELRDLLEALRRGTRPPLSVDDVELLLGWLIGSAAHDDELPRPGHDPVLLQMVLYRLDDVLFDGGELRPAAAGLDTEESARRRRIRFRRLASAFHPDRFPDLADWLTQRSQAVHRAYARFKQDPEAPAVPPAQSPYPPGPVGRNVRPAAPRVRKHRFRAFADQLRARFGNDRYLPHKLIGGLAVLALLPVLNMVLVPSPGSEDIVGSTVSSSDSVDAERPVSAENSPTTKLSTGVGAGPAGDGRNPDSDSLARQAPTPVASPEAATESVGAASSRGDRGPETRSLARQAPTPVDGSDPAEDANPAPALSTDVGAGPAGEEPSSEARIAAAPGDAAESDAPARKPETGNRKPSEPDPEVSPLLAAARRAMNPNGEIATVAALQTVDEQLAAMGLEDDTERLYRRIGEEEEKPVSGFRGPVSGEQQTADAARSEGESVGAASSRDDRNPDSGQISAGAGSGRDERRSETRIAAAPGDADEQEPPVRKSETENRTPDPSAPESPPTKQTTNQPTTNNQQPAAGRQANPPTDQLSTGAGAGPAGEEPSPEARMAAAPGDAAEPDAPARKPETRNPKPAPSAQPDSELVLGPLGRHPAGRVLQRFHAALQAANIAGIAGSFAPDARMDSLRGRDEIAEHFRSALNPADSRRVNLKVRRLGREDGGWRVEADLDVRVDRNGHRENLLAGRSNFLLTGRGDQLMIARMDLE